MSVGAREHGDPLPTCKWLRCVRVARAGGFCHTHYYANRRLLRHVKGEGPRCLAAGCALGDESRGLCRKHYMRLYLQVRARKLTWVEAEALGLVRTASPRPV